MISFTTNCDLLELKNDLFELTDNICSGRLTMIEGQGHKYIKRAPAVCGVAPYMALYHVLGASKRVLFLLDAGAPG